MAIEPLYCPACGRHVHVSLEHEDWACPDKKCVFANGLKAFIGEIRETDDNLFGIGLFEMVQTLVDSVSGAGDFLDDEKADRYEKYLRLRLHKWTPNARPEQAAWDRAAKDRVVAGLELYYLYKNRD